MNCFRFLFFTAISAALLVATSHGGTRITNFVGPDATLYGASQGDFIGDSIFEVDPTSGEISNSNPASGGSEVYSLATQPGSNLIYCVYREFPLFILNDQIDIEIDIEIEPKFDPFLSLGTIDPATGVITRVANFSYDSGPVGAGIAGITFDCDGSLFAVTGGKFPGEREFPDESKLKRAINTGPGLIFSVDPLTANLTLLTGASPGQAQSLEYNPEDGLLYHFYSQELQGLQGLQELQELQEIQESAMMETVDPRSGTITQVPLSGDVYDFGIQAVVFAGNGTFLGHQSGRDSFYAITAAGEVSFVGPSPESPNEAIRGLAYSEAVGCTRPEGVYQPDLLIGKRPSGLRKDDFYTPTGQSQTLKGLRLSGRRGSSLSIHLEIQNDGSVRDQIFLLWNIKNLGTTGVRAGTGPRYKRQIFLQSGDGLKNVTNLSRTSGFSLNPGGGSRFVFKLTVRREPVRRITRIAQNFRALSGGDDSKFDHGKALIRVRK